MAVNDLHFAVVVGINRYPGITDLKYARDDAQLFRDWLVDEHGGGLPDGNAQLLVVPAEQEAGFATTRLAQPKRSEVNEALRDVNRRVKELLAQRPGDWDKTRLYVYVSGHGIAPPNGQAALLTADADRDTLGENIELSLYNQWYISCGFFHELVILADCCRERFGDAPVAAGPPFNLCQRPLGRTVTLLGFATGLADQAFEPLEVEDPDLARGYFTRALIAGLRRDSGAAAVDSRDLATYVNQSVVELTQSLPYPQQVQFLGDQDASILFRSPTAPTEPVAPARAARQVVIRFPPGYAGPVLLRAGDLTEIGRWDASNGPWELELEEALYGIVPDPPVAASPFRNDGMFSVIGAAADVQL